MFLAATDVPEPVQHVAEFILYAMPGFLALHLYRAKYPVRQLSEFQEVAWSLIYGVVLVTVLKWADINWLHYSSQWGSLRTRSTSVSATELSNSSPRVCTRVRTKR
jgi:hypothetical protein